MTDEPRLDDDPSTDDLREAVLSLRERVSELEGRMDSTDTETDSGGPLDHYDERALDTLDESVSDAHPQAVIRAYEQAGIVNEQTKKKRAKRLKRLEG